MKTEEFKRHYEIDSTNKLARKKFPTELKIVAEGDSWFKYTLKKDIIDHLREMGYAIDSYAKGGDTLENMVYGTEIKKIRNNTVENKSNISFQETLSAIRKHKPIFFLFSAGGNDIVGEEILQYLNHAYSNSNTHINDIVFEAKLDYMQNTIEHVIKSVRATSKTTQIIMDGYDYPIPDGRGYKFTFFNVSGPWILPAMGKKHILDIKDQKKILKHLVDSFNGMLAKLASKYFNFHHIDLRGMFPHKSSWHNEIHLNNSDYKTVAAEYHKRFIQTLGYNPLVKHSKVLTV